MSKEQVFSKAQGRLEPLMLCWDCGRAQRQPLTSGKCQNWQCPSHVRKIQEDPTYVPTIWADDPVAQVIEEMVRGIEVAVSAQEGLSGCPKCRG